MRKRSMFTYQGDFKKHRENDERLAHNGEGRCEEEAERTKN